MIFIDTAALIGRYLKSDQHYGAAVRYWRQLEAEGTSLFISNFILDEALTLLARRAGNRWDCGKRLPLTNTFAARASR
jgi:predicted nucleic acid-binding protein